MPHKAFYILKDANIELKEEKGKKATKAMNHIMEAQALVWELEDPLFRHPPKQLTFKG